ncbi:MAG: hypothetical protein MHM6MM_000896 [Cercozoa sp. M6MM]
MSVDRTQGKAELPHLPTEFPPESDFINFDANLTEGERAIRKKVRDFMETEVRGKIDDMVDEAKFPTHLLPKLAATGLVGGCVGGYGAPGLTLMETAMACTEMARVDASVATLYMVHGGLAMESIAICGSEEQKQRFFTDMTSFKKIGCFCLTEPDFGSDASSLQTIARKVPGGYEISGKKRWIGNGTLADVIVVWARNDQTNQVQGFIVEGGAPGLTLRTIKNKIALRMVQNAHMTFNKVFVPDRNVMPKGRTFATGVGKALQLSRVFVGWLPVGICMGAYDAALAYLKKRTQFGAPLAAYQLMQEKLVRMLGTIQAMWLLAERVTRMVEQGTARMEHITMVKAWNSLRGREVVALAREVVGGNGIVLEYGVAKSFCDMEAVYTYEGSYEVNTLVTGRAITGLSAFKARNKKSK